jgi:drug/metabolite transporter (DMT)-like permease
MKDDPVKGVVYYLVHSVLLSINLYTNKALFGLNPTVSVLQFTFARGLISVLLSLLMSHRNLKHELVDCVDRSSFPSLVFRCLQGALSVFISFMCIKYFDVSTVGIVCSLTPLFVCLLAYFMLGERL